METILIAVVVLLLLGGGGLVSRQTHLTDALCLVSGRDSALIKRGVGV